jgi:hypothetical protein
MVYNLGGRLNPPWRELDSLLVGKLGAILLAHTHT